MDKATPGASRGPKWEAVIGARAIRNLCRTRGASGLIALLVPRDAGGGNLPAINQFD
jgi:hypothetical protein